MRDTIHSTQSQVLREALKAIRKRANLSQRELCTLVGREHSFIDKLDSGERRIDIVEFYWICNACGAGTEGLSGDHNKGRHWLSGDDTMIEENFRLYVDGDIAHYRTMDEAKEAAKSVMSGKPELRIEVLADVVLGEADFWACNCQTNQWEPS